MEGLQDKNDAGVDLEHMLPQPFLLHDTEGAGSPLRRKVGETRLTSERGNLH